MKLKHAILILTACFFTTLSAQAEDAGLRYIKSHGAIRCGTTLNSRAFAYRDEDKQWQGFDAEMCKIFASAIFGNEKYFELVNVPQSEAAAALQSGKVDVMLGNTPYSASLDISRRIVPAGLLYFDRQMFAARNPDEATSMLEFKGKTVCAVNNSEELYNLDLYNRQYKLKLKTIKFPSRQKAKEAFMLNRCALITGNEAFLKSIAYEQQKSKVAVLPEVITAKPVYAYVSRDNTRLQSIISWLINNLYLAEEYGITTTNVDILNNAQDQSIRNMLGLDPKLWQKFEMNPKGFREALKVHGNYADIYHRTLGDNSDLNVRRITGSLSSDGGVVMPRPFL